MAILANYDDETREGYCAWSIELLRRGLLPYDEIEVHGPHGDPPRMWGKAECRFLDKMGFEIEFNTGVCTSIWAIKNVRVKSLDGQESFPILPMRELSPQFRKRIVAMRHERQRLRTRAAKERQPATLFGKRVPTIQVGWKLERKPRPDVTQFVKGGGRNG